MAVFAWKPTFQMPISAGGRAAITTKVMTRLRSMASRRWGALRVTDFGVYMNRVSIIS